MNSISIQIVMYVADLDDADVQRLGELPTDSFRSLIEDSGTQMILQIKPHKGIHAILFAPITHRQYIAWMIGVVQGMGGYIMNIRREVMEGEIA